MCVCLRACTCTADAAGCCHVSRAGQQCSGDVCVLCLFHRGVCVSTSCWPSGLAALCAPPDPPVVLALPAPAGHYQRRVAAVRLLGELYNYKLITSQVIFATLHLILAYGHEAGTPPEVSR